MANRIVGNTYILDTGSGNVSLPWPSKAKIQAVLFWGTDTGSKMVLSGDNTANHLIVLSNPNTTATTVGAVIGGVEFEELKIPVLTSGTAWVHFV